jgi:hypothetical protein
MGMEGPEKVKTERAFDSAVVLLGTSQKESKAACNRDTCRPMFSAILFTDSFFLFLFF